MPNETNLDSFVLRFMQEAPPRDDSPRPPGWHGSIRHVQSNAERYFTRWADALAFLAEFVDLQEDPPHA